jgi:hypothetical protein
LTVSPNPVRNQLYLKGFEKVQTLAVYDMNGQELLKVNKPGNTINIQSLNTGVYIIKLTRTDNSVKSIKIVKQ